MNPEPDARAVIERYLHEVLAKGSAGPSDGIVADAMLHQSVRAFRTAFGDLEITPNVIVVAGEYAAVNLSARGTHRGLYQGLQPTGRSWSAGCSAVFRVERGRITDSWVTWDTLAIIEQIAGGILRPPGASA